MSDAKPHIKPHSIQPSCSLKWACVSQELSMWGHHYERIGTGYSPLEAYRKWARQSGAARLARQQTSFANN